MSAIWVDLSSDVVIYAEGCSGVVRAVFGNALKRMHADVENAKQEDGEHEVVMVLAKC